MVYRAASDAVTGQPWTQAEIDLTVEAYFEMLSAELRGERIRKAEVVRRLREVMPARNERAIEAKFQNISAVLDESGFDWIDGYKPLEHYQRALKESVDAAIVGPHSVREAFEAYESSSLVAASPRRLGLEDVLAPIPGLSSAARRRTSVSLTGSSVSAMREFRNHQLGSAGERWVVDLERESLNRAGRSDLAERVSWAARERGDGLGYDVTSFRTDGSDHVIEVKTTNLGPRTPFYITRWEIDISRELADRYSLYRVHGFARDPRIYVLEGSIEECARLEPKVFLGLPIAS
jgi:hypothetical protein